MSWYTQEMAEWAELHEALHDTGPMVCITHKRFVPCRADDGHCAFSEDKEDVEAVTAHQLAAE